MREKWIGIVELWNGYAIHQKSPLICSAHFELSMIRSWDKKCILHDFAVPTVESEYEECEFLEIEALSSESLPTNVYVASSSNTQWFFF